MPPTEWTPLTKPASGSATAKKLVDDIIDDLDYLYSIAPSSSSIGYIVPNGGMEGAVLDPTLPDRWVFTASSGASGERTNTQQADGAYSFGITVPQGSAAQGQLESADFVPVTSESTLYLKWWSLSTNAYIRNVVTIDYYDKDQELLAGSSEVLYDVSSGNPTTWQVVAARLAAVPATAKFLKIKFETYEGTNGGTTYWDSVDFFEPVPISGNDFYNQNGNDIPPGRGVVGATVFISGGTIGSHYGTVYPTNPGTGNAFGWLNLTQAVANAYVATGCLVSVTYYGARA